MGKFREYIEKWLNGENVRNITISLYDIHCIVDVYNGIVRKEKPEFINEKVKQILDKCRIKTIGCGIGWKVA